MKKIMLGVGIIGLILLFAIIMYSSMENGKNFGKVTTRETFVDSRMFGFNIVATLYKDPNCGCCVGYADELRKNGFDVDIISTQDMASVKDKYNIPLDKQSCHTVEIFDYVVEGHVPMLAIKKLLDEKPNIDGIGLPRMPSGTPGMPGKKLSPYKIYQIKNKSFSNYLII